MDMVHKREDSLEFGGFWQNDTLVSKTNNSLDIEEMKQIRLELGLEALFEERIVKSTKCNTQKATMLTFKQTNYNFKMN